MNMGKKKKEKVIYIDDGRTVADMSGVGGGPRLSSSATRPRPDAREVWKTYWGAVKRMFVPMLVVLCAICILYMVLYLLFWLM